jgi:hypothetical protein
MEALFSLQDELRAIFVELGLNPLTIERRKHFIADGALIHDLVWISKFLYPISPHVVHWTTSGFSHSFEIEKKHGLFLEAITIVILREELSPSCEHDDAPKGLIFNQKSTYVLLCTPLASFTVFFISSAPNLTNCLLDVPRHFLVCLAELGRFCACETTTGSCSPWTIPA